MKTNQIEKATPRPWRRAASGRAVFIASGAGYIAEVFHDEHSENVEANAALIVQAVNERDALIAVADAAERVASAVDEGCDSEKNYLIGLNETLLAALKSLATLRASKGGQ